MYLDKLKKQQQTPNKAEVRKKELRQTKRGTDRQAGRQTSRQRQRDRRTERQREKRKEKSADHSFGHTALRTSRQQHNFCRTTEGVDCCTLGFVSSRPHQNTVECYCCSWPSYPTVRTPRVVLVLMSENIESKESVRVSTIEQMFR